MRRVFLGWLALALLVSTAASAQIVEPFGDEDPYPLACFDFSGTWRADNGETLGIEQSKCRWLKVRSSFDSQDGVTTIVPDDKDRSISGLRWTGVERHRWNDKQFAKIIETHRTLYYEDRVVTELILLDKVNDHLLLESLYRTTEMTSDGKKCPPEREIFQKVYRLRGANESKR